VRHLRNNKSWYFTIPSIKGFRIIWLWPNELHLHLSRTEAQIKHHHIMQNKRDIKSGHGDRNQPITTMMRLTAFSESE
jgi:hypothetical protein